MAIRHSRIADAGNHGGEPDDLSDVDCSTAREALSATLDHEDPGVDPQALQRHLEGCPSCRAWQAKAANLNRRTRLAPAEEYGPDHTEQILAAVWMPRRGRWRLPVRIALIVVALAQLAIGLTSLLGPVGLRTSMAVSVHMDHEEAAFNLAFAAALLLIGCKPRTALSQLPVLGSFVLVLAIASAFDLADGHVGWSRLATHAPIVVGLLLSAALAATTRIGTGPAATTSGTAGQTPAPGPHDATTAYPHPADHDHTSERGSPPPAARREIA